MENQILAVAQQLCEQGKTPTVALVKAKLLRSVPMPLLLRTLRQFDALSKADRAKIGGTAVPSSQPDVPTQALAQQVALLQQELTDVKQQLAQLTQTVAQYIDNGGNKQ